MKKLIIIALVAIAFVSCGKDEVSKFQTDPLATLNLKGATGIIQKVKSVNSTEVHLTALQIVKQTERVRFIDSQGRVATRMFDHLQRDTVSATPMLKMWASDILRYDEKIDGTKTDSLILEPTFLKARKFVFLNSRGEIIAYIPNSVLRAAQSTIETLFSDKNYEAIYPVFNDAYKFYPTTDAEYATLNQ